MNLQPLNPYNIIKGLNEENADLAEMNAELIRQVDELSKTVTITDEILKGLKTGKLKISNGEIVEVKKGKNKK